MACLMQASRRPEPQDGIVQCVLSSLLQSAVSLRPLLEAAASHTAPDTASRLLRSLAEGPLMHAAPSMARFLGEHYHAMPSELQQVGCGNSLPL